MATSDMPADAPNTKSAAHSVSRFGASEGSVSASVHRASSPRSAVLAPRRWLIAPASGMASEAPIAGKARAMPNCPALTPAWSWIQGTRVAKLPVTAPCTVKTAAIANLARLTCSVPKTVSVDSVVMPPCPPLGILCRGRPPRLSSRCGE